MVRKQLQSNLEVYVLGNIRDTARGRPNDVKGAFVFGKHPNICTITEGDKVTRQESDIGRSELEHLLASDNNKAIAYLLAAK